MPRVAKGCQGLPSSVRLAVIFGGLFAKHRSSQSGRKWVESRPTNALPSIGPIHAGRMAVPGRRRASWRAAFAVMGGPAHGRSASAARTAGNRWKGVSSRASSAAPAFRMTDRSFIRGGRSIANSACASGMARHPASGRRSARSWRESSRLLRNADRAFSGGASSRQPCGLHCRSFRSRDRPLRP